MPTWAPLITKATKDVTRPGAQAINMALENGWITARSVEITEIFKELSELLDQGEAEALGSATIIIKAKQRRPSTTQWCELSECNMRFTQ